MIYVFLAKVQTRNLYFCWVCDGASCNTQKKSIRTQKPFNQGSVSGVKSKQKLAEKSLVICAELKTQCLRNHTGCTFQMVNQVILQQLGKWQRTRGFMKKKMCAALHLALFLMKLSIFVVLCHVFSIPLCSAHTAYSKFVFTGVCGVDDTAKKLSEREAHIKDEEKDRAR